MTDVTGANEAHRSPPTQRLKAPGEQSVAWRTTAVIFLCAGAFIALLTAIQLMAASPPPTRRMVTEALAALVILGTGLALLRSVRRSRWVAMVLLPVAAIGLTLAAIRSSSDPPSSTVEDTTPIVWIGTVIVASGALALLVTLARSPQPNSAGPGWYADPADGNRWRYWNGAKWTDWVSPPFTAPT